MSSLDALAITPWLVFDITGQWCLLALLATFALAKHLPQRTNPFLVNFILTTFLSTIPPALLLYTGNQFGKASNSLCFVQAALVDGVTPMFGVAQVVLVFDTWSELRSSCFHTRNPARKPILKYVLILVPYLVLWIWTFSSFVAAAQSKATRYDGYVYCVMNSVPSIELRNSIGFFMAFIGLVELLLGSWVCLTMYRYRNNDHKHPDAWRDNVHFASRILVLSLLQFMTVLLTIVNDKVNSPSIKFAYDLMISMNGLVTFIVFFTQKAILKAWKFWGKKTPSDVMDKTQLPSYTTSGSIDSYSPKLVKFEEDVYDREEKS